MSKKFEELVTEALVVEKELRALSGDKPSIRGWVDACLKRGGLDYEDVEATKERLGGDYLKTRAVDSGAYLRDVRKYIMSGSMKEPPEAARVTKMYFSQRDGAVAELGGEKRMLFALFAVAAESVYQEKPELFGGIDDIDGHKAKVAQLAARREELHRRIPTAWDNSDVVIGRITSDFAALITWRMAPDCPVGNRDVAERLIDHLLERDAAPRREAA
jgi:hypothetical protein